MANEDLAPLESNHTNNSIDMDLDNEEESDIWTFEGESPACYGTLSWEALSSRFPTMSQIHLSKRQIGSAFLTEAPLDCFESVIKREDDVTVKEEQLVKSLVQAIVGRPSIYFSWDLKERCFKSTRPVRILGVSAASIQPIVDEILSFGGRMKAIEYVAKECQLNPRKYGLTGVAFACCLLELLLNIQNSLINMFEDMKYELTILKVYQYVHKIQQFDLVQSGKSAFYRSICLTVLCYTSVPYLNILSKWLGLDSDGNGVFEDPYQEFFICKSMGPYDSFQEYQIKPGIALPYFISIDLAIYILRSGISLQLLRQMMPNHPLCELRKKLPLKCHLRISETNEYMCRITSICKYVQTYNSANEVSTEAEEEENGEELEISKSLNEDMMSNIPSLPPWDERLLIGEFSSSLNFLLKLTNENSSDIIPTIDTIAALSYIEPVQAWCPILNESYMSSFLHQFKLQYHLSLLYDTFLLGNGTFLAGLESVFFKNENKIGVELGGRWPPRLFDLNLALRSIMLETIKEDELFAFDVTGAREQRNPNAFDALNFLQLHYNAKYPLNLVITPNIQLKYNRVFTFLIQLFRVTTVSKRIYNALKANNARLKTNTLNKLYRYRFQFDQFLRALQGYVYDTVISETWHMFMEQVQDLNIKTKSNSTGYISVIMQPQMFKSYHEHILDRILYQCFLKQSQQRIFKVLQPILQDVLDFASIIDIYYYSGNREEHEFIAKCEHVFDDFQNHVWQFVNVLKLLEEKGSGRLGNILNSTNNEFRDLYGKHEAKKGLDVFVKDLLTRIDLNTYYENPNK
ncbi:hypothetical protein G6F57_004047 [Rhizopus arrhizus]|nr:hypothetical protein G6F23_000665 [Rhizopus arrhizus]KAG1426575.1 hypothetical protein G6F58_001405 [Rhizopus delemar]KAG0765727.1 hypothetical protein G6F24_004189 [Rhizopus arrhizus]KAG0792596.1 hypothetical protein G6F21_004235 [Rhizopus arrhizus]KAG0801821.1 hypothetical protein G6F22_000870 [Rhizopus arrhizus]